ncbi:MAG: nicotinate-nucleotide--dimethylbenzimidazole phosphoribosyltransferase, partial [Candidatus Limnocylindrales bacterium]
DVTVGRRVIVVAAADHGVARRGVSAYPPEVTAQMVANFLAGGAAINVLAAGAEASLVIVDAGVASQIAGSGALGAVGAGAAGQSVHLLRARIRDGTSDMTEGPAMTREEALRAVSAGVDVVAGLRDRGLDLIGVGEMGIGNTTAASALTAVLAGTPPDLVTGLGTGLDEDGRRRKVAAIERALKVNAVDPADPLACLAAVGGFEIAVLVGVILGAVAERVPVLLDGFITGAAALVAVALAPGASARVIASHRSAEPGHAIALERLGLQPLLALDLRLGEGTGAALAMGLIDSALRLRDGMATFDSARVAGPVDPPARD